MTYPDSPETHHSPPVPVELAVSKLQELCHSIETGVEKPIEEDEPYQMVGDLWETKLQLQTYRLHLSFTLIPLESLTLTASFKRRSMIRE